MVHDWLDASMRKHKLCVVVRVEMDGETLPLSGAVTLHTLVGQGMCVAYDMEGVRGMYCSQWEEWNKHTHNELEAMVQYKIEREAEQDALNFTQGALMFDAFGHTFDVRGLGQNGGITDWHCRVTDVERHQSGIVVTVVAESTERCRTIVLYGVVSLDDIGRKTLHVLVG